MIFIALVIVVDRRHMCICECMYIWTCEYMCLSACTCLCVRAYIILPECWVWADAHCFLILLLKCITYLSSILFCRKFAQSFVFQIFYCGRQTCLRYVLELCEAINVRIWWSLKYFIKRLGLFNSFDFAEFEFNFQEILQRTLWGNFIAIRIQMFNTSNCICGTFELFLQLSSPSKVSLQQKRSFVRRILP